MSLISCFENESSEMQKSQALQMKQTTMHYYTKEAYDHLKFYYLSKLIKKK